MNPLPSLLAPAPAPGMSGRYYVYQLPRDSSHTHTRFRFFPVTTPTSQMPDIRILQPRWMYDADTGHYKVLLQRDLVIAPARARCSRI